MEQDKPIGKPFEKGDDSRRNTSGANKGSKWKSTLLKDLMTIGLSDDETETFKEFADKFPTFFNSDSYEKNFQLFMELKQMSLVFHKNPSISQNAINAIKDRVEGKPVQTNIIDDKTPPKRQIIDMSDYKKNK